MQQFKCGQCLGFPKLSSMLLNAFDLPQLKQDLSPQRWQHLFLKFQVETDCSILQGAKCSNTDSDAIFIHILCDAVTKGCQG